MKRNGYPRLFKPIMGMEPSTIYRMLPVSKRKEGVVLDASITNPDMARNYGTYIIENLQVPTPVKIASIEAIPDVIKSGKIIGWIEKNNGTLFRIVVAAPITIGKTPYQLQARPCLSRGELYVFLLVQPRLQGSERVCRMGKMG